MELAAHSSCYGSSMLVTSAGYINAEGIGAKYQFEAITYAGHKNAKGIWLVSPRVPNKCQKQLGAKDYYGMVKCGLLLANRCVRHET